MKIYPRNSQTFRERAFTLVEVLIAVAVIGIAVTALYLSISSGFRVIETARENLRATQIMVERLETIRLYKWREVTNDVSATEVYVIRSFTNYYNHVDESGFPYFGTISIDSVGSTNTYDSEMRKITVNLTWTSGGVTRNRSMQSLIAQRGIQNYVY